MELQKVIVILVFIIIYVFNFTIDIYLTVLSFCLVLFHFYLRDSFSHFIKDGSSGVKLPHLCLSSYVLASHF